MESGVPKIGPGLSAARPDLVRQRNEREREDAEDFIEALEELGAQSESTPPQPPVDLDVGYPTDDETGLSIDVKA